MSLISELGVLDLDEASIRINWANLNQTKPILARGLIRDADSFHEYEMSVQEEMCQTYGGERYHLRPYNLPETLSISNLTQGTYERRVVQFKGIVTYVQPPKKYTMYKEYECKAKNGTRSFEALTLDDMLDTHSMPKGSTQFWFCKECHNRNSNNVKMPYIVIKPSCVFVPVQMFMVQELVTEVGSGRVPAKIECYVLDDLAVNKIVVGEQVTCVGLVYPTFHKAKQALDVYAEVVSIVKKNNAYDEVEVTAQDEALIKQLASSSTVYDSLIKSYCPSIYGLEDIKLGLLCSLFGAPRVDEIDIDGGTAIGVKVRGDVNAILCGDPGTSKSMLINQAGRISPRPIYASGSRATEAGLTVTWVKGDNGLPDIKPGAAVLADNGGIIIWDEVEKSTLETRNGIHKAMEDQFMPITMAGVTMTFNTREPWICAANPKKGRYDPNLTLLENVDLDEPFIGRFDIVFVMRDLPKEESEKPLADAMVQMRSQIREAPIPLPLLRKYIAYAKRVNPEIIPDSEAMKLLKDGYLDMRLHPKEGSIPPTPRILQALMRVSLALARMSLSSRVEVNHAKLALQLLESSTQIHSLALEQAQYMVPDTPET